MLFRSPPDWFKKGAKKWAKVPYQFYSWKNGDYSFSNALKLIKSAHGCNIGIRGYAVVDFDNMSIADIEAQQTADRNDSLQQILNTRLVKTASCGIHAYFRVDEKVPTEHYTNGQIGIDFISQEEYVVAPPSIIDDTAYTLLNFNDVAALTLQEYDRLKDYLISSFHLKHIADSGEQITKAQGELSYITLKNNMMVPRISYEDTVEVSNSIFTRAVSLRPDHDHVKVSCPLHPELHKNGDDTPSASIFKAGSNGLFHCHRCDYTVDIYYILHEVMKLDFVSAIEFINSIIGKEKYRIKYAEGRDSIRPTQTTTRGTADDLPVSTYPECSTLHSEAHIHSSNSTHHHEAIDEAEEDRHDIDIEKVQKAFNRKGSKLEQVYSYLLTHSTDSTIQISSSYISTILNISKIMTQKYFRRLTQIGLQIGRASCRERV